MSNFTPGKWDWHFEDPKQEWAVVMAGGKAGQIVANVNTVSCPDIYSAPNFRVMPAAFNAALIAAAPEMYSLLELVYKLQAEGRVAIPDELDYKFITDIAALLRRIDNPEAS